jgi:predicted NUDIX family phosphoesterase/thymidylate kinase
MAEKSKLQKRAEEAASRFAETARKSIVIEFAGVPKAGKTTTLGQIQTFLKRCGFKVEVVVERASVCPIKDKKHVNFNIWTACTTLAQILEKTQNPPRTDDPQVLILDRGIFDAVCWLRVMERLQRIRRTELEIVERFLKLSDWRDRISGVIFMTVAPEEAMQREQGMLPVEGGLGSVMNESVLHRMLSTARSTAKDLKDFFRIFEIDTSKGNNKSQKKTAEEVAEIILNLIEEQLQEDILTLPKRTIKDHFGEKSFSDASQTSVLVDTFQQSGSFDAREQIEKDFDRVQALPVVVVRNASGDILRLRRREKSAANALNEKLVIWAGGHVRKEDNVDGKSILHCLKRELEEELRLRIEPENIDLLGAVYIDEDKSSSKHVAIVYQWRAPSDDVEVAISHSEFFERKGTSLSGQFVKIAEISKDITDGKIGEPWSDYIIRELIPNASQPAQGKLL